jgi:hypothetical protein
LTNIQTQSASCSKGASLPLLKHSPLFGVMRENRSLSVIEQRCSLLSARFYKYRKSETECFYAATCLSRARFPALFLLRHGGAQKILND